MYASLTAQREMTAMMYAGDEEVKAMIKAKGGVEEHAEWPFSRFIPIACKARMK